MNKLNINVIALALGLVFSAGAMGQKLKPAEAPSEAINQTADAGKDAATVKRDALYEAAKEQCNSYPAVGAKAHCLDQMKAGFGKF